MAQNLTLKFDSSVEKFHFPVKVKHGQVIGIYEILFKQPSQFIYQLGDEKNQDQ